MAKCKLCKTDIPDGSEYCKDCRDKDLAKANESYLDSLLNSVKNTVPSSDGIYKKRSEAGEKTVPIAPEVVPESNIKDDDIFNFDIGDIEDFDKFNFGEDISDLHTEDIISDEDLFGGKISADTNKPESLSSTGYEEDNQENMEDDNPVSEYDDLIQEMNTADSLSSHDEDGVETDLDELLNQLDNSEDDHEESFEDNHLPIDIESTKKPDVAPAASSSDQEDFENSEEEDFLSLLNQISSDDPVADDVKAISNLIKGVPDTSSKNLGMPSDVGEVFSDALKAVSKLNDSDIDEEKLLNSIPDKKSAKGKKAKKKSKKTSGEKTSPDGEKQSKISLWQKLFGNVEDKKATKKKPAAASDKADTEIIDVPKKGKAKKEKKGKEKEEETQEGNIKGKSAKADQEEPEDKGGKDKKKAKKEKKKKSNDIIQVIDEIDEDVGRINRLGATIVFVFFGLLALLIYAGSNAISYTLSIEHATSYFSKQKYTEAYDEVYGINIEDDDKEIYSKIMTVMFVNKQLNSYNNYCTIGEYPKALDSLLKGLKRYDKYIKLATMLGIRTDMNYVRDQIIAELKNKFKLSEEDALKMINIEDMKEYSVKVYNVALENE